MPVTVDTSRMSVEQIRALSAEKQQEIKFDFFPISSFVSLATSLAFAVSPADAASSCAAIESTQPR